MAQAHVDPRLGGAFLGADWRRTSAYNWLFHAGVLRFCDLQAEYAELKDDMQKALNEVLDSTAFIMGPQVHKLEQALNVYTGAKHSISCSSGTHAIEILLRAMDIGAGHEVITVPFTWISTAEVIPLVGARPG